MFDVFKGAYRIFSRELRSSRFRVGVFWLAAFRGSRPMRG